MDDIIRYFRTRPKPPKQWEVSVIVATCEVDPQYGIRWTSAKGYSTFHIPLEEIPKSVISCRGTIINSVATSSTSTATTIFARSSSTWT